MAVTPYDEQEKAYLDIINNATTVEEISEAKAQLNNLSSIKWDTVENKDLATEIRYRLGSQDMGIYPSEFKKWEDTYNNGTPEEAREASLKLLKTSDKIIYSTKAKNRKAEIEEERDRLAGDNRVEPGGTGTATLSGGSAYTVTQDENGIFTITPNDTSVPVKEGTVIGGRVDESKLEQDINLLDRRPAWTDTNIEYHRKKTADGFAVDSAIIKRYYSVIDAEVYFGNEYVEDIHDINWAIQQNVQPLFGYNSYTYDEIARGNRLIVGNFTIAFTSPNYLFSILAEAAKANGALVENMASYSVPKLSDRVEPVSRAGAYGARETGHHAPMWPQTFDLDIIMGEKSGAGDPVHIIILGAAIQNCQTVLSASAAGTPPAVMEQYSFIARDVRTSVLSATGKTQAATPQDNTNTTPTTDTNESSGDSLEEDTALGKPTNQSEVDAEEERLKREKEAKKQQENKEALEEAEKMKEDAESSDSDEGKTEEELIKSAERKGYSKTISWSKRIDENTNQVSWTFTGKKKALTAGELKALANAQLKELIENSVNSENYDFSYELNGNIATYTIKKKT